MTDDHKFVTEKQKENEQTSKLMGDIKCERAQITETDTSGSADNSRLTDWSIVGVEGSTVFVKLCGRAGSGLLRFSQRFPVKVGLIFKTKLLCAVSTAASGS